MTGQKLTYHYPLPLEVLRDLPLTRRDVRPLTPREAEVERWMLSGELRISRIAAGMGISRGRVWHLYLSRKVAAHACWGACPDPTTTRG